MLPPSDLFTVDSFPLSVDEMSVSQSFHQMYIVHISVDETSVSQSFHQVQIPIDEMQVGQMFFGQETSNHFISTFFGPTKEPFLS